MQLLKTKIVYKNITRLVQRYLRKGEIIMTDLNITGSGITQSYRETVVSKATDSFKRLENDINPFVAKYGKDWQKAILKGNADALLSVFQQYDSNISGDLDPRDSTFDSGLNPKVKEMKCFGKNLNNVDIMEMLLAIDDKGLLGTGTTKISGTDAFKFMAD